MAEVHKKNLPELAKKTIMLMTFGNLGVSMAFSLQSSSMGRIFQTIGADPTKLGFFFILPPLVGMFIQPLVGYFSDKTWLPKLGGRRMPYLLIGALVSVLMMMLLPNSGSFGFGFGSTAALAFGAFAILFMDLSSNMAMQPFKMIIGDMVPDDQKNYAWSYQTIWGNIGSILATLLPFILTTIGVSNVAAKGSLPNSVIWAFYIGAFILVVSALFSVTSVKEYNPEDYAKYHQVEEKKNGQKTGLLTLIKHAPKVFWTLAVVQFFAWAAFQYLWTYGSGAIAQNVWHTTDPSSAAYQAAGNWFGILSAVQAVASVVWGFALSKTTISQRSIAYAGGLIIGGIGFMSVFFIHSQFALIAAFIMIGIGWVSMNAIPFMYLTSELDGENDGTYLGLFNSTICLPQIVASVASFAVFPLVGQSMPAMLLIAGALMVLGAIATRWVK
ncbi:SLC45 family MFS transporter [Weissella viridescens]|uniref:SLC45 family MFS transporter n=2 Tax=Weissella viridescens TaxID=1629 RepID=UPI0017476217|nr:SLC45 family MFS transporter [Weissella viridescens]QOD86363.1 SLC45 family MFS transporter [Weissella viridescens]